MYGLGFTSSLRPKRVLRLACVFSLAVVCTVGVHAAAASAVTITDFSAGLNPGSLPSYIARGADGTMWFTDDGSTPAIGKITPSGTITEYSTGLNPGSLPQDITAGANGTMWFTDMGLIPAIGKITPSGAITEYSTGLNPGSLPYWMATGVNGNIWFSDVGGNLVGTSAIGEVTPSGAITESTAGLQYCGGLPGVAGETAPGPSDIERGADGNMMWFTDSGSPAVGTVTSSGVISEYCTGHQIGDSPDSIAAGLNGSAWFTKGGSIGKVTTAGTISSYSNGLHLGSRPFHIALGRDGNMWFTDEGDPPAIGKITPSGAIHEYSSGLPPISSASGIVAGPGGMWFLDNYPSDVGMITPAGVIHVYSDGGTGQPWSIARGASDTMWFTTDGAIGRITMN